MPGKPAQVLPIGLRPERHLDPERGLPSVWWRRLAILVIAVIPVLALLGVFGQSAKTSTSTADAATLEVSSPDRLRGGLVFTTTILVTAHRRLGDARLSLQGGWFDNMTFNGIAPQPQEERSSAGLVTYDLGVMEAGTAKEFWISWQTNATRVGRHDEAVALYDSEQQIISMPRSVLVFP